MWLLLYLYGIIDIKLNNGYLKEAAGNSLKHIQFFLYKVHSYVVRVFIEGSLLAQIVYCNPILIYF